MLQRATHKSKHNLGTKLYITYGENMVIVLFNFYFFFLGGGGDILFGKLTPFQGGQSLDQNSQRGVHLV